MLQKILTATRNRIGALQDRRAELRSRALAMPPARSLADALSQPGLQVIAEIKRRSPSAGLISATLDPTRRASLYVAGGAAAISVVTEPDFFDGSLEDLVAVRAAVPVPVLRKDFTLDAVQIYEARAAGSDAVLLIVAALDEETLGELMEEASHVGIDALVEAHDADDLDIASRLGASIVGVNNRNLSTFVTDIAVAEGLAGRAAAPVTVAESGVATGEGAARMARAGYDAILVGEALVRSDEPATLIADLLAAARHE